MTGRPTTAPTHHRGGLAAAAHLPAAERTAAGRAGVDLETAYARQVVVTKRALDSSALSSASHPNMVASMLEQLAVRPGQRILEIGSATGINAA